MERFIPPKKGKGHVMRVVAEILRAEPHSRATDLNCALELLSSVQKRKCVAFLISDFIADRYERSLRLAASKHDLIPIQIVDPREEALPDVGYVLAEDLETGELVEIDTSNPETRAVYAARVATVRGQRERLFRRLHMDHVTIRTDLPYVKPIVDLFRLRLRRARHG